MKTQVLTLNYEKGFYQNSNGNKRNQLNFSEADCVWTNGNGFYKLTKYAKYILTVCINSDYYRIDIRRMFGEKGIKLTAKVRKVIENNKPQFIEISEDGKLLDQQAFDNWIDNLKFN